MTFLYNSLGSFARASPRRINAPRGLASTHTETSKQTTAAHKQSCCHVIINHHKGCGDDDDDDCVGGDGTMMVNRLAAADIYLMTNLWF